MLFFVFVQEHQATNICLLMLQIPCSLEYWDELQKSFVTFREFSLSESKVCELPIPDIHPVTDQKELVASDLWRIVLNSNQNVGDDQR